MKRPKPTRLKRPALLQVVKAKLFLGWSLEQIAAWLKLAYPEDSAMCLSHEGIYRSIYYVYRRELDRGMSQHLRSGNTILRLRKAKRSLGRGRLKNMVPITARPASIEDRVEVGHWEGDLVMGKRPSAVATLVERTSLKLKPSHHIASPRSRGSRQAGWHGLHVARYEDSAPCAACPLRWLAPLLCDSFLEASTCEATNRFPPRGNQGES